MAEIAEVGLDAITDPAGHRDVEGCLFTKLFDQHGAIPRASAVPQSMMRGVYEELTPTGRQPTSPRDRGEVKRAAREGPAAERSVHGRAQRRAQVRRPLQRTARRLLDLRTDLG